MTRLGSLLGIILVASSVVGCAAEAADADAGEVDESEVISADPRKIASTTFSVSSDLTDAAPFVSHGDHLTVNVAYPPIKELAGSLDSALGARLRNRGEAHITVLTPPEAGSLRSKLPMRDIEALARDEGLQTSAWSPVCLGVGVARQNRALQTYYVVVKSDAIVAFRRKVKDRFIARGGSPSAFDADAYAPHITLGFTQRDLFESDGVVKDPASCPRATNLTVEGD